MKQQGSEGSGGIGGIRVEWLRAAACQPSPAVPPPRRHRRRPSRAREHRVRPRVEHDGWREVETTSASWGGRDLAGAERKGCMGGRGRPGRCDGSGAAGPPHAQAPDGRPSDGWRPRAPAARVRKSRGQEEEARAGRASETRSKSDRRLPRAPQRARGAAAGPPQPRGRRQRLASAPASPESRPGRAMSTCLPSGVFFFFFVTFSKFPVYCIWENLH